MKNNATTAESCVWSNDPGLAFGTPWYREADMSIAEDVLTILGREGGPKGQTQVTWRAEPGEAVRDG